MDSSITFAILGIFYDKSQCFRLNFLIIDALIISFRAGLRLFYEYN